MYSAPRAPRITKPETWDTIIHRSAAPVRRAHKPPMHEVDVGYEILCFETGREIKAEIRFTFGRLGGWVLRYEL
jgi:hypothetical protein